jgi:hypothetical protein
MPSVIRGNDTFDRGAGISFAPLDVPQQSNFPHDITWPTKPE